MKMTWETYSYLRNCLEEYDSDILKQYKNAHCMLEGQVFKAAREELFRVYKKRRDGIQDMKTQLKYAAGMSEGPNATKEMKEFWGLPIE